MTIHLMLRNDGKGVDPDAAACKSTLFVDALAASIRPHMPDERHDCIAQLAYQHAARRGFAPGHELDDWLEAEREVDARLIGECYPF